LKGYKKRTFRGKGGESGEVKRGEPDVGERDIGLKRGHHKKEGGVRMGRRMNPSRKRGGAGEFNKKKHDS